MRRSINKLRNIFNLFRGLWKPAFLHVIQNDAHCQPFIDLTREHFGKQKHLFLIHGGLPQSQFKIPAYHNVIVLQGKAQFWILGLFLKLAKKIYFHGLLDSDFVMYLSKKLPCLQKGCWVVLEADLHPAQTVEDAYSQAKKVVVQNLRGIAVSDTEDCSIVRQLYGFQWACHYSLYQNPIKKEWLQFDTQSKHVTTLQIGRRADESVLPILRELARFKESPIRIRVILSSNLALNDSIVTAGKELFGDKFAPVPEPVSSQENAKLMLDTDVLILNQSRQKGLESLYAFLYRGAKVYVRSDSGAWNFLRNKGFEIFDTLKLHGESFETLIRIDQADKTTNRETASPLFNDDYVASVWGEIFGAPEGFCPAQKTSSVVIAKQRRAKEFDWEFYTGFYPDLKKSGVTTEKMALLHWLEYGWAESRAGGPECEKYINNKRRFEKYLRSVEQWQPDPNAATGPLINILTRSNKRPFFFQENRKSVEAQSYKNYRQLVSYENDETLEYLQASNLPSNDLVKVVKGGSGGTHPYNLFSNELMDRVTEGWVLFLDDDDLLTTPHALAILAPHLRDEDSLVISKMWFPDKTVPDHANIDEIKEGNLASSCFAFHIKHKEIARWDDRRAGDFRCFNNLRKHLKPVFLDDILARTNYSDCSAGWGQAKDKNKVS